MPRNRQGRWPLLTRRRLVGSIAGVAAIGLAACAPAAPPPSTAPPAAKPTAPAPTTPPKPTSAPAAAASPAAAAKPTAAPAVTQAPAKATALAPWRHAVPQTKFDSAFESMALEKGFFAQRGLDVKITPTAAGNIITQGMVAGEFDSADTSPVTTFPAIDKGAQMKIIGGLLPRVPHVLFGKKDINDLKDLYGRTVGGGPTGAFLHALLTATMAKEGLDPEKIEWANIGGSPDVFKAVVAGKVDAGVSSVEYEPDIPPGADVKLVLAFGPRLPNYINKIVQVTDKALTERREQVIAFATAYTQGYRWAIEHKDDTVALAIKMTNGKPDVMKTAFDRYIAAKLFDPNMYVSPDAIKFTQEMGVQQKQQERVLPVERVATWDIQQAVVKALGEAKPL